MGRSFGNYASPLSGSFLSFTAVVPVPLNFDFTPSSFSSVWGPVQEGSPGWIGCRSSQRLDCSRPFRPCHGPLALAGFWIGQLQPLLLNWPAVSCSECLPVGSCGFSRSPFCQRPLCLCLLLLRRRYYWVSRCFVTSLESGVFQLPYFLILYKYCRSGFVLDVSYSACSGVGIWEDPNLCCPMTTILPELTQNDLLKT